MPCTKHTLLLEKAIPPWQAAKAIASRAARFYPARATP